MLEAATNKATLLISNNQVRHLLAKHKDSKVQQFQTNQTCKQTKHIIIFSAQILDKYIWGKGIPIKKEKKKEKRKHNFDTINITNQYNEIPSLQKI